MEDKVEIKLTEEERGLICTALNEWSWDNPRIDAETYDQITELIERIAMAY